MPGNGWKQCKITTAVCGSCRHVPVQDFIKFGQNKPCLPLFKFKSRIIMVTRSTHTVFPMTLLMLTWTSSRDRFTAYNTSVCHAANFLSGPDLVDECRGNGGWLLRRLSLGLGVIPLAMVIESGVPCMASVGDWGTDIPSKHWKWFNTSGTDKLLNYYMSHIMRKPVMPYGNNKGTDQPAHQHSLISAFVVRCLDCTIPLVSISKISSLYVASVAAQASLSLTWSQIPKTGFLVTRLIWWFIIKGSP